MIRRMTSQLNREEGHATPAIGTLIGAAGAIVLTIGAVNDNDVTAWIGGIVLALGLIAGPAINHATVEKGIYKRLDDNNL